MRLFLFQYILPLLLITGGAAIFYFGVRERTPEEKFNNKDLPTYGKGGVIHHVYIGSLFVILGFYLWLK